MVLEIQTEKFPSKRLFIFLSIWISTEFKGICVMHCREKLSVMHNANAKVQIPFTGFY